MSTAPRHNRMSRIFLSTVVLALVAALLSPIAAGAQGDQRVAEVGDAATTPIAAPFVGSYEVWCTMGNPAPGTLCQNHHSSPAVDFGMAPGTPINATGDGVVSEVENSCVEGDSSCRGGAGKFVSVLHDDGRFSRYLHLSVIFVEEGQTVEVGDVLGEAGNTGRTSAPHLHYDEQFPVGTRIPMGTLIACVDGEQVLYPDSLGYTDWNDVPFGTLLRNDDYSCLANASQASPDVEPEEAPDAEPTEPEVEATETTEDVPASAEPANEPDVEPQTELGPTPIIASGDGIYGVTASIVEDTKDFEAEVRIGDLAAIVAVTSTSFTILDEPAEAVEIRVRRDSSEPWSPALTYDPTTVELQGPTCEGLHATSGPQGTRGPDVIIGTDGDDLIHGEQGDDFICAGDGDDTVFGGRGADVILGEAGDDNIRAGIGRDTILGGTGDDALRSGNGIDVVLGQAGDDFVLGGNGNDDIGGGAGDDLLDGRNGDDIIKGGGGDDTLIGNRHNDELIGGDGVDTFDGGTGTDTCTVRPADGTAATTGCES